MSCIGYLGELIAEGEPGACWIFWTAAIVPLLHVGYERLVGFASATQAESDPMGKGSICGAQLWAQVNLLTYPVVLVVLITGPSGAKVVVAIQNGLCVSDIIS